MIAYKKIDINYENINEHKQKHLKFAYPLMQLIDEIKFGAQKSKIQRDAKFHTKMKTILGGLCNNSIDQLCYIYVMFSVNSTELNDSSQII